MDQVSTNAEQQWQLARVLLAAGKMEESLIHLETAATALHPAACFNLGSLHLFNLIENADKTRSLELIKKAAELGHGGAFYQLAMLELCKHDKEPNWQYANECCRKSAELGFPTALRSLAIHWSRSQDSALIALGTLCLEHAALAGDVVSLALLMHRIREGIGCVANPLRANAINTLLMQTDIPIDPSYTKANPHFAQASHVADLPTIPPIDLRQTLIESKTQVISESPWVVIADDVLNEEECRLIRYLGGPLLEPSITADPDGKLVQVQLRSSFDMAFSDIQEDITLLLIQKKMATLVNATQANSEPLRLLRYQNGQEYQPHRDYLPPSLITPLEAGGAGQRVSTVIVYLNDVSIGGETEFIELNKKIAPKLGRVLAFKNLHEDGTPDTRTLHAGLPVKFGTKWIATMWIHQGVFRK